MERPDGRRSDEIRPVKITRNYLQHAEGSVLIEVGQTKVVCAASLENKVPPWLRGGGRGWVTAEYGMLPRSTAVRKPREAAKGRQDGRTYEIQRLVGRALRSVADLAALGERTIWIDCDVIQADGGTRTASVTGAFVALVDALMVLRADQGWEKLPVADFLAATSVGIVQDRPVLDLNFTEDSAAAVDMNIVATGAGNLVEVQGTGEMRPFSDQEMQALLGLAKTGVGQLIAVQKQVLGPTANLIGGCAVAHSFGPGVQEPS